MVYGAVYDKPKVKRVIPNSGSPGNPKSEEHRKKIADSVKETLRLKKEKLAGLR